MPPIAYKNLCLQFRIRETDAQLPGQNEFGDSPPPGYVAVNRYMLMMGAVPPFNPFLEDILRHLAIAPMQLHPNGYAILIGLYVLFMRVKQRAPSFKEICSLYAFKRREKPSIIFVEAKRSKVITDLVESVKGYIDHYCFIRCPDTFLGRWMEGGERSAYFKTFLLANFFLYYFSEIPSADLEENDIDEDLLSSLTAVPESERTRRYLITEQSLYEHRLLDPTRTLIMDPGFKKEFTQKSPAKKAALKKCSDPAGSSKSPSKSKLSQIEEGEESQSREGKGVMARTSREKTPLDATSDPSVPFVNLTTYLAAMFRLRLD